MQRWKYDELLHECVTLRQFDVLKETQVAFAHAKLPCPDARAFWVVAKVKVIVMQASDVFCAC